MKRVLPAAITCLGFVAACSASSEGAVPTTAAGQEPSGTDAAAQVNAASVSSPDGEIVDGGLAPGWTDNGWSATITESSVEIELGGWGGWIVGGPELGADYSQLVIEMSANRDLGDDAFSVSLDSSGGGFYPTVVPDVDLGNEPTTVTVPLGDLLGAATEFDMVVIGANGDFDIGTTITIERMYLVPGEPEFSAPDAPADSVAFAAGVDCSAETMAISPNIYGVNRPLDPGDTDWGVGYPSRRWGGNPTSRYNWQTSTWNTAEDWYFENVYIGEETAGWIEFLDDNWANEASSAVTVPMLGWVSKDDSSASFPTDLYPDQEGYDPERPSFGNGRSPDGDDLEPPQQSATSVESTPDDVTAWIEAIRDLAADSDQEDPFMYFLDNEPMLWHLTHRDVVAEPVSYEALLAKSVAYASAIRAADPDALIAGPAVWGWPAYFFSAVDAEAGFDNAPDRRSHGGEEFIAWYLQQFADLEATTGQRLLDVLDVHYYPQDNSYGGGNDDDTAARRPVRTTRSLWDGNYQEESWVEDTIELIPRMQAWVDENYPGTKLSIGEYSFGGENHISGAIAEAEALGRFGQGGVFAAYYWITPPANSPVNFAFRAYLNYDGEGSRFGTESVPTETERPMSLFASTDGNDERMVLVAINQSFDEQLAAEIELGGCADYSNVRVFQYDGTAGLEPAEGLLGNGTVSVTMPAASISVIELTR